jgi:hypothetical protein
MGLHGLLQRYLYFLLLYYLTRKGTGRYFNSDDWNGFIVRALHDYSDGRCALMSVWIKAKYLEKTLHNSRHLCHIPHADCTCIEYAFTVKLYVSTAVHIICNA